MRWVLMLFVILAAVMGGEARAVVVTGRAVVSERVGKEETLEKRAEALRVESERASRVAVLEVQKAAGLVDAGPLALWFPGGSAVARSDCGDRQAVFSGGTSAIDVKVVVQFIMWFDHAARLAMGSRVRWETGLRVVVRTGDQLPTLRPFQRSGWRALAAR
jgi:hypothetical protein